MKVPPPITPHAPTKTAHAGKTSLNNTRSTAPADAAGSAETSPPEPEAASAAEGRDFASVFDEVSRPPERKADQAERNAEDTRAESRESERADGDERASVERRDERRRSSGEDDSRGNNNSFGQQGQAPQHVREASAPAEAPGARAVLHIADLERIVSAVRSQTLLNGRQEIVIELRRSVLEGLRVRLSADPQGRVTAELIASSERARAQLDARAGELAEVLRGRGVKLAELRTSVGADSTGQQQDSQTPGEDFHAVRGAAPRRDGVGATTDAADVAGADDAGSTYRA